MFQLAPGLASLALAAAAQKLLAADRLELAWLGTSSWAATTWLGMLIGVPAGSFLP